MKRKCELSLTELENTEGKIFKVTRRMPEYYVAETKFFRSKQDARKQFDEWLNEVPDF